MGNIANYLEEAILNHVFRNVPLTSPAAVYLGLVSDVATDADMESGTLTNEIIAYTGDRPVVAFGAPAQISGRATILNTGVIDFVNMPAVTVKYAIVCDGLTKGAGNILYWCPLVVAKVVAAGNTFELPIDNLILDLD
jgi:hypothetical protein